MDNSPTRGFRRDSMDADAQDEMPTTSGLLEDIRRRLLRAFQRAVPRAGSRRAREEAEAAAEAGPEELCSARVEGALAALRAELLEMRFQNRQLARTLLDLNMKMQQLKKEYELEIASESQDLEDHAVNQE